MRLLDIKDLRIPICERCQTHLSRHHVHVAHGYQHVCDHCLRPVEAFPRTSTTGAELLQLSAVPVAIGRNGKAA